MEQTTQQISQKNKTITVGILMLLIGGAGLIFSILLFYQSNSISYHQEVFFLGTFASIIFGIIFFVPGLLILLKKRLGWWRFLVNSL